MKVYEVTARPMVPETRDGGRATLMDERDGTIGLCLPKSKEAWPSGFRVKTSTRARDELADVIFSDVSWPLWSRRLISALRDAKDFPHIAIDAVIWSADGRVLSTDYAFVFFDMVDGVLDLEQSEYRASSMFPELVANMKRPCFQFDEHTPTVLRCREWPKLLVWGSAAEVMLSGDFSGFSLRGWDDAAGERVDL
jgi:hypothetical protein